MEAMNNFANTLTPKLTLNFKNLGNAANTWTNNNAESMHNIMKIDTNWRPHSTPALIDILHGMVKLQLLDLQRAQNNIGNFRLFCVNRKYCIREDIFRNIS